MPEPGGFTGSLHAIPQSTGQQMVPKIYKKNLPEPGGLTGSLQAVPQSTGQQMVHKIYK